MSDSIPASIFHCPNCNAEYQLVKVEAPPNMAERQLTCLKCGGPLNAREGRFVLKYFFTSRSGRRTPVSANVRAKYR
jgi:hypothetical protein